MQELDREKRIQQELNKLVDIYDELPREKFALALPLIQNVAFLKIVLEEMQEEIKLSGYAFNNGLKESPVVNSYNKTFKSYVVAQKRLEDLLPEKKVEEKKSKLEAFLEL